MKKLVKTTGVNKHVTIWSIFTDIQGVSKLLGVLGVTLYNLVQWWLVTGVPHVGWPVAAFLKPAFLNGRPGPTATFRLSKLISVARQTALPATWVPVLKAFMAFLEAFGVFKICARKGRLNVGSLLWSPSRQSKNFADQFFARHPPLN